MTKHITEQEMLYKKLVSKLILNNEVSLKEKEFRLFNFLNQSDFYYDVFCESVYQLMTNDSVETISLDDTGYPRVGFICLDDYYVGFELLSKNDIESAEDDIIIYVNLALERLQYRLSMGKFSFQKIAENFNF